MAATNVYNFDSLQMAPRWKDDETVGTCFVIKLRPFYEKLFCCYSFEARVALIDRCNVSAVDCGFFSLWPKSMIGIHVCVNVTRDWPCTY